MIATSTRLGPSIGQQIGALLGFLALSLAVSALGGALTAQSIATWYPTLAKPSFNPPDWLFAPVWSLLYLMMAVAAWRVWRVWRVAGWRKGGQSLSLYIFQLIVNLAWSALFFGLQRPDLALIDCLLLLVLIAFTALSFWRHDNWAALLMVPYAAWVAFAALLNSAIVVLN
nr:TspO/MBR family protein [uncultured Dongia sp.]